MTLNVMTWNMTREEIHGSYSITDLQRKKQELVDLLQRSSFTDYEVMEIKNLISTITHRIQLMDELLGKEAIAI